MNRTMTKELLGLRACVFRARQQLDGLRVRPPCLVLKETLIRYLADAIITAEVIDAAVTAKHPAGTEPLIRHLFEIAVDVMYVVTEPDPTYAAARTVAWNILRWQRTWDMQEDIIRKDPTVTRRDPGLTADVAIENFVKSLQTDGDDGTPVRRAYDELKAMNRLPLHWSGRPRTAVIAEVETRAPEPDLSVLGGLWHMLSTDSHPSPWAARIHLEIGKADRVPRFTRDPAIGTEDETMKVASHATIMVDMTRRSVDRGFAWPRSLPLSPDSPAPGTAK
jgi:hypothetical protein